MQQIIQCWHSLQSNQVKYLGQSFQALQNQFIANKQTVKDYMIQQMYQVKMGSRFSPKMEALMSKYIYVSLR